MKSAKSLLLTATACAGLAANATVTSNIAEHSVTFTAKATGVKPADAIEFLAIGPLSDRAYESFAVTDDGPEKIATALEAIKLPRGKAVDMLHARLWPQGEKVQLTINGEKLSDILEDKRAAEEGEILSAPLAATLGSRDATGAVVAATNIPCAVFAMYSHAPSLLQFNAALDQSAAYGRFSAKKQFTKDTPLTFKITWDGKQTVMERIIKIAHSEDLSPQLKALREEGERGEIFAQLQLENGITVTQAASCAAALDMLDGKGLKLNGTPNGQFFYRAFLPDAKWRERQGRLFQPFEVRLTKDGRKTFTFIEEDFGGDGIDPVLKPHMTEFKEWNELTGLIAKTGSQGEKINVMFIFADKGTTVNTLQPILGATAKRINTFYIFGE